MIAARTMAVLGMATMALPSAAQGIDQTLIDAAKKEGQVVWYTTQIVNQFVAPTAAYFEKKYGVKVNYARGDSRESTSRVINEAKAGKTQADVIDGTGLGALVSAGYAAKWQPEGIRRLPQEYWDTKGYWSATNLYVRVSGYNTDLVKKGEEPRSYEDLLDPKWKNRMGWAVSPEPTAVPGFVGVILSEYGREKGLDYLKKLATQNITPINASARKAVDNLMAGEYAIGVHVNNSHVQISKQQGAPVEWVRMQPAIAFFSIVGMTKDAPHVNAGKLLVEFLVSKEGQKLYADADYLPVDPDVPPRDPEMRPDGKVWRVHYLMPDEVEEKSAEWYNIWKDIFR